MLTQRRFLGVLGVCEKRPRRRYSTGTGTDSVRSTYCGRDRRSSSCCHSTACDRKLALKSAHLPAARSQPSVSCWCQTQDVWRPSGQAPWRYADHSTCQQGGGFQRNATRREDVNVPKRSTNTTAKVRDTTLLDWAMIRHAEGLRAPFEGVLIG